MKYVAITQRVELAPFGERRDALDQRWNRFLKECGIIGTTLPNNAETAVALLRSPHISGLILSGGNDLPQFGGDVPERDATERAVLELAITNKLPILGVCRGMQFIADYYGSTLGPVSGHAGVQHPVMFTGGGIRNVNSFHNYGVLSLGEGLTPLAAAPDGSIEAYRHERFAIHGMMWHPERENVPNADDISVFQNHFGVSA
jgi:putative glutamine amidotransferase